MHPLLISWGAISETQWSPICYGILQGSISYFHHYDGLGSTKALTDANQNTQASYTYTILGDIVAQAGTVANSYKYAGEDGWFLDSDIDLYHSGEIWYTKQLTGDIVLSTYSNNKGKEECPSWYPKSACPEWRKAKKACGGINAALPPQKLEQRREECCSTSSKLYEKYGTGNKVVCEVRGSAFTRAQDCHRLCLDACIENKSGNLGVQKYADCEKEYKKIDWCDKFGNFLELARER